MRLITFPITFVIKTNGNSFGEYSRVSLFLSDDHSFLGNARSLATFDAEQPRDSSARICTSRTYGAAEPLHHATLRREESLARHCCSFALRTASRVRALDASSCVLLTLFGSTRVSPRRVDRLHTVPARREGAGGGGGVQCMRGGGASSFLSSAWLSRSSRVDFASRTSRTSSTSIAIIVAIRPGRAGDDFFHPRGCTVAWPRRSGFSPGK